MLDVINSGEYLRSRRNGGRRAISAGMAADRDVLGYSYSLRTARKTRPKPASPSSFRMRRGRADQSSASRPETYRARVGDVAKRGREAIVSQRTVPLRGSASFAPHSR